MKTAVRSRMVAHGPRCLEELRRPLHLVDHDQRRVPSQQSGERGRAPRGRSLPHSRRWWRMRTMKPRSVGPVDAFANLPISKRRLLTSIVPGIGRISCSYQAPSIRR